MLFHHTVQVWQVALVHFFLYGIGGHQVAGSCACTTCRIFVVQVACQPVRGLSVLCMLGAGGFHQSARFGSRLCRSMPCACLSLTLLCACRQLTDLSGPRFRYSGGVTCLPPVMLVCG